MATHEPDTAFHDAVVATVAGIPPGTVMTYGEVAAEAGRPGAARAVGRLLRRVAGRCRGGGS